MNMIQWILLVRGLAFLYISFLPHKGARIKTSVRDKKIYFEFSLGKIYLEFENIENFITTLGYTE